MKKATIKKSIILIVTCFTVFVLTTAVAFAETSATTSDAIATATPTVAAVSTTTATTSSATTIPATNTTSGSISIAPDSVLYPLKLMVESVRTTLSFTPEGKAELLVSFANKRLAEANLMTERNKQELVLSVMHSYVKTINAANEKAQEAATMQTAQDVKPILDSIQITEQSADNFVIKVTGTVPQNISDQLKTVVADQVKRKIVNEAVAASQEKVKEASQQVNVAEKQLAIARKSGNETLVKSATDTLAALQKIKEDALTLKNQAKAYKKDVVRGIKQQEAAAGIIDRKEENGDENEKSCEHSDKSNKHKDKKHQKHQDKLDNNKIDNQDENSCHDKQDNEDSHENQDNQDD